jgi:hypothetical protein
MSNAHKSTIREDLHTPASGDPLLRQVYTDALGWIGGVYQEEDDQEPRRWRVCHTDTDGRAPVGGTYDTFRLAAVSLAEEIERRNREQEKQETA